MTTTGYPPQTAISENRPAGPGTGFASVRRGEPLFHQAWQNDISENSTCPFCGHHAGHHTMMVTTPHFYQPVEPEDSLDGRRQHSWPNPNDPEGQPVHLVQVSEKQEVVLMQCRACALRLHTDVATCLSVTLGYGTVRKGRKARKKATAGRR